MVERKRDADLDLISKAFSTNDLTILGKDLQKRAERVEHISRLYFSKTFKFHSDMALARRVAEEFSIPLQQARKDVSLCKQLYVLANPIDWSFERALLLHSIKDNINIATAAGDMKTRQKEHRNLIELIGDKAGDEEARVLNISVINYNPQLVGAKEIPDLENKIAALIEKDKQEEQEVWQDYELLPEKKNDPESGHR